MDHLLDSLYVESRATVLTCIPWWKTHRSAGPIKGRATPPDYYQEGKKSHGPDDNDHGPGPYKPPSLQLYLLFDRLGNLEAVNSRTTNKITTSWGLVA